MRARNGVNTKEKYNNEVSSPVDFSRRQSVESVQAHPLEGFRGFEKVPLVIVPRYDITPYLDAVNNRDKPPKLKRIENFPTEVHAQRLNQKCVVKISKQDLEKLKSEFERRRDRRTSTGSVSDCDSNIMYSIKCKICDKTYASEKKLINHQENKHMIVYKPHSKPQKRVSFSDHVIIHEVKEYHKCRKCPKIFETYKLLKTHMKLHHKKRKCYICDYCNKNFVDRTIFKVHIKLHCDVCGLLLPSKLKVLQHRRIVCGVIKTHKCKTCNESYFKFMDLKDHSYVHISDCYVCDICKDQFITKCALAHHIQFLHSNDRPKSLYSMRLFGNERIYLCNFCEDSSVEKDLIESHVQVLPDLTNKAMTGYKDYYFCDQCMKKFDTEKDMLQHKWTHFLKNSDNSHKRTQDSKKKIKTTYKNGDVIPEYMKPVVSLEKLLIEPNKVTKDVVQEEKLFDVNNGNINKAIVDPISKKTILSKHQCQNCGKYYSSNYCLNRHIETQHSDYDSLKCKVCEETFVWPSLLQSHKCIRLKHPEMPFQDARPEIHFDNLHEIEQTSFDDFNIGESDDYINSVDFEIPAPIVELTEYENIAPNQDRFAPIGNLGYKIVMQEVPIEF